MDPPFRGVAGQQAAGRLRQGDSRLHLYDLEKGKKLRVCEGYFPYACVPEFSADGKQIAIGSNQQVCVCDVATGKLLLPQRGHNRPVQYLAAAQYRNQIASAATDGFVILWDRLTGQEEGRFSVPHSHPLQVRCLAYSPDGKFAAAGIELANQENVICLIDPKTTKEVRRFTTKFKGNLALAALTFSPDGKTIVAAGTHKEIQRWQLATGKEMAAWHDPH